MEELTRREKEKLERENMILSKAEDLFSRYGVEKASMDILAKESQYTKRTIYRYFTCKEDLVFAVALRGCQRLTDMIEAKCKTGKTGLEKIRLAYYAYYDFSLLYPEMLKLINNAGTLKQDTTGADLPYRQKYMNADSHLFKELIQMFNDGKSDRSIRSELEMPQLALSSIFTATGFFIMLSMSGDSYTGHFGLDKDAFVTFTIEMFIDSLKSK